MLTGSAAMAELFMECEEEELEPWQQKSKPIVVDDDDDDEPIFVGEILSSKPTNTYILNRINPNSSRIGMQNGATKRGAVAGSPGFHSATRGATSTLAVQPQPRTSGASGASQVLQRPLPECSLPQEAAKLSSGISQPIGRSAVTQPLSRNLSIPGVTQSASRPVATVTAQPIALNRAVPNSTSTVTFGSRQSSGVPQCQSGSVANTAGLNKRPSTLEANSITSKKAKVDEIVYGNDSSAPVSVNASSDASLLQKGLASSNVKNGAPFPQACPKCNIHFNLLEPLKNHIKYCCPDMVHSLLGITKTDISCSGTSAKISESEKGKLIMLVNDFYYGKHEGNVQQVRQEQKTHTTFKCASCMKLLKSNIRFMNHMKHHLELEKQNSESWENHTTCQHCYRQFPTPFQLQCHIESTHTPHESSTLCKICELSFETEQVLLQHMKDNHKPGEMPYVCQVCNYRSSAFSDVEKHFRAVHENTKNLLCPFCLKVIKIGAPYMHHFMRHQKKGVQRCNKCRLQFLTSKERTDHKSQHHRTFKKPVQLEGLPPGTKVTIRASVGSLPPGASAAASPVSPMASSLLLSPGTKVANVRTVNKLNVNKAKPKLKPLSIQKRTSLGTASSSSSSSSSSSNTNKKNNKIANTSLNNLRCPDIQKCIECCSDIRTFASHFPAYVRCSLCRYSTSCSKAYVNHMMSFHSARQSKRFWIYKTHSEGLRDITVVCLNCDFLADVSGLDKMAAHLNESPGHTCQVILESAPSECPAAGNPPDLVSDPLKNPEGKETPQKASRPSTPEEQKAVLASLSPQRKDSPEGAKDDHLGPPSNSAAPAVDCEEEKVAAQPSYQESSGDRVPSASGAAEDQEMVEDKGPSVLEGSGKKSPCLEHISSHDSRSFPKDSEGAASLADQGSKGPSAAVCKEDASSSGQEDASSLGPSACSRGPTTPVAGGGGAGAGAGHSGESPLVAEREEKTPESRRDWLSDLQLRPCPEATARGGGSDGLANQSGQGSSTSALGNGASGCLPCSDDPIDSAGEGDAAHPAHQSGGSSPAAERNNIVLPAVAENSVSEVSTSSGNCGGPGGGVIGLHSQGGEGLESPQNREQVLPSVLESPSSLGHRACCSNNLLDPTRNKADPLEMEVNQSPLGAECKEEAAGRAGENISLPEPAKEGKDPLGNPSEDPEDSLPESVPPNASHVGLPANVMGLPCGKTESDDLGHGDLSGEGKAPRSAGKEACAFPRSEDTGAPLDEADLAGMDADDSPLAPRDGDEVSFEQFLRHSEPTSVNSDTSEQGSIRLEPLTPSEVLEHEATEILQKGGVAPSAKKTGPDSEQPDVVASRESSPCQLEASTGRAEESEEAS